jgi:hypothetical protein
MESTLGVPQRDLIRSLPVRLLPKKAEHETRL